MPNQCDLPVSSTQRDIGRLGQDSKEFTTSPNIHWYQKCMSVSRDQRAYTRSLSDQMMPRLVQRLFNGLDPKNPALSVAGSDHPHIKESIKIKPQDTGSRHVMWRSMRRSCIIGAMWISSQFEQDQPPEYAYDTISASLSMLLTSPKSVTHSCKLRND
jgi:hypothetical protein